LNTSKTNTFKYDEAIAALLDGTHQSYMLDSGQTSQRVTRLDLEALQSKRDIAATRLSTLAVRLRKTAGVKKIMPGW
jgi:hypothetical protein